MAKINNERVRRANNARLKQYERLGVRLFMKALKAQAVENPSPLPMQEAYIEFYQTVFVDSAKREWNRIRMQEKNFVPSDFFLNTWREYIKGWVIVNLDELIAKVNDYTFEIIKGALSDAIQRGLNPFQTAELLLDKVGDIKRARAIARTESTRANNQGKEKSANDWANETGQQLYKLWVHGASRDPRIEHYNAQNKPIRKDQAFSFPDGKGGIVQMDKPGDIQGGAYNTVNCSCTIVYVSERFARRNYPESF